MTQIELNDELKELKLKAEKGLKEGLLSLMSEKDQKILSDIREGKWNDFDIKYKWNTSVDGNDMEVWEEQRSEWIIDSRGQSGDEPLATLWSELVNHSNDDEAEDLDELTDLKEELQTHIDWVMGYRCEGKNDKLSILQRNAIHSYGNCRSTDFRNWREALMNQFLEEQSFAGFDEIDEILNELWGERHKEIHNKLELMNTEFHQELLKEAWQMDEHEGHHVGDDDFDDANEVANKLIDQITIFLMNREYNNEEEYEAPDMDELKAIREKYCDPNSEPELIADDPASSEYDVISHMMDNRRKVLEYKYDEGYYNAPVVDGVKRPCYAQACFDIATTEEHKEGGKQCGFTLTYEKSRPVIKWDDEDDQNESTSVN